jgi:hypothetical protein
MFAKPVLPTSHIAGSTLRVAFNAIDPAYPRTSSRFTAFKGHDPDESMKLKKFVLNTTFNPSATSATMLIV